MPIKLLIVRNKNRKNIKGKYCKLFVPIFFSTSVLLNINVSSIIDCHFVGIILLFILIN